MSQPLLLLSDVDSLRRKIENPPAGLDAILSTFYARMENEPDYRRDNYYLLALLGDQSAQAELKRELSTLAEQYIDINRDAIREDSYGYGTPALRHAVYTSWLEYHGCLTPEERKVFAEGQLRFGYYHCANVLRSRVPTSDNQSFGVGLSCAVIGLANRHVPGFEEKAQALHEFGLQRIKQVLSMCPRDGYLYEGATYQSHVVTFYAGWATALLRMLEGPGAEAKQYAPNGATLLDLLRTETLMPSPGLQMPGWDHYGWRQISNLNALSMYASLTGELKVLSRANDVPAQNEGTAWRFDDRMWAIIYWPDAPIPAADTSSVLTGWTLPQTAAVIDDHQRKSRLLLAWDRCGDTLQAFCRNNVDPNHLLYELNGVPVFGDGVSDWKGIFPPTTVEQITKSLSDNEHRLILEQYGSIEKWLGRGDIGLIGASNSITIDREDGYFPDGIRRGQICFEQRTPAEHIATGDATAYYCPRYDLTRARRTIATHAETGVSWIVDDYRAESEHDFTWNVHLRMGGKQQGDSYSLDTADGVRLTLAWLPVDEVSCSRVANYPHFWYRACTWPETGSDRLQLTVHGKEAHFVTCIVPGVTEGVTVKKIGDRTWTAEWPGGTDTFTLPLGTDGPLPEMPEIVETFDDIDAPPFALSDAPTDELLAQLAAGDPALWRESAIAAETLVDRGVAKALPLIQRLLVDPKQFYVVHSVAAKALGKALYAPALDDLRLFSDCPEPNTALRARWAVGRIEKAMVTI